VFQIIFQYTPCNLNALVVNTYVITIFFEKKVTPLRNCRKDLFTKFRNYYSVNTGGHYKKFEGQLYLNKSLGQEWSLLED